MFNKKEAFLIQKPIILVLVYLFLGFLTVGEAVYANTPGKKGKSPPPSPTSLETEGQTNSVGIIDQIPEFTAIYNSPELGNKAEYYRIQVTKSGSNWGRLVWDSNKTLLTSQLIKGSRSEEISYNSSPLAFDGTTYYWRIKFWDDQDNERAWSKEVSYFKMASSTTVRFTVRFYAGTGDGEVRSGENSSWNYIHDTSSGDSVNYTIVNETGAGVQLYSVMGHYYIWRGFFPFDTSALPDNAMILAATLKIYPYHLRNEVNDGHDYVTVVKTFQESNTQLVQADYEDCGYDSGHEEGGRAKHPPVKGSLDIDFGDITVGEYLEFPLNSIGLEWINKTGYTKLGTRIGHDIDDHPVANVGTTYNANKLSIRFSEYPGIDYDPYLEVIYVE